MRRALAVVTLGLVLTTHLSAAPAQAVGKVVDDRALKRTGAWTSKSSSTAYLKTLSKSKAKGAKLTSKEATADGGAVSFQVGPGRGKADIVVGGVKKKTVNTDAATKKTKVVKFSGSGVVTVKVRKPGKGVYVDVVLLGDVGTPPSGAPHPGAGEVIFTEWLSNPDMVDPAKGEWFELANVAEDTWNLDGCTVTDQAAHVSTLSAPDMPGSNTFVFARSANTTDNGGITVDGTFSFALVTNGSLTLTCGSTVIDTVSWTGETSGQTTQLDPDHYSASHNDNAANYCVGTTAYGTGGDLGTPKASNVQCP